MNIHEAKEQIKNAVTAYLTKDDLGRYVIPPQKQRPIFLMGPPGVGKTAIMEQVASELGIGLLSYSMTHHTRQSALGLPLIKHVNYQGASTMFPNIPRRSSSVYELMEAPAFKTVFASRRDQLRFGDTDSIMLQFLYKVLAERSRLADRCHCRKSTGI
ncbi:MAG: AAA family ATPase [Lachnospiraceae bacterium]